MNQTKFQIGDQVTLKSAPETSGQVMTIARIRNNARGENEYQLAQLTKNDPLNNHDWFNEENIRLAKDKA